MKSINALHNIAEEIIQQRIQKKDSKEELDESPSDLLDYLIQSVSDKEAWSVKQLRDEVMTFLFAGHDTTYLFKQEISTNLPICRSSAITWAVVSMATHKEIEAKVTAEIDSRWSHLNFQTTFPSIHDINELTYTTAVFKESLRLYPPVGVVYRKATENVTIAEGIQIPKNVHKNLLNFHKLF
jgi:cytochrome P450